MASSGGGTGKVSSGPLKGKVVYLSEGEIKTLGKVAGLNPTQAFDAMKAGNNPIIQAGIQLLADTGAKTAKTSMADVIADKLATKAAQAQAEQQLAGSALIAKELSDKLASASSPHTLKNVTANADGTFTVNTKQGTSITYDSVAKVQALVDTITGSATPAAKPKKAKTPKTDDEDDTATLAKPGTSTIDAQALMAKGLPVAEQVDVIKNGLVVIKTSKGDQEITADTYGGIWAVHESKGYGSKKYSLTHIPSGLALKDASTKSELAAAAHALLGIDQDIDWTSPSPFTGKQGTAGYKQAVDVNNAIVYGNLKGIKTTATKAADSADNGGTPATPAAPATPMSTLDMETLDTKLTGITPAQSVPVEKGKTISVGYGNQVEADVYDGVLAVHKNPWGSGYKITHLPSGNSSVLVFNASTKGEAVAATHALLGLPGVDWKGNAPLAGMSTAADAQYGQIKSAIYWKDLKGVKASVTTPKAPKAPGSGTPKASKGKSDGYKPFNLAEAPTVAGTPGTTKMLKATYQGNAPDKWFDVPDLDPLDVTYSDGSKATLKPFAKSLSAANTKANQVYAEWASKNGPGTTGYKVLNNRYQTPAYRAINSYLRWKGQGKSDAEIDNLLKTDPFVTYSGTIFSPGKYGYYNGIAQEYTAAGMQKLVAQLNESLSSSPLPETTIMYRGISRGTKANPNPVAQQIFKANPGDMLDNDPAFQSITINKNHALNYATKPHLGGAGVMMTVIVPKGTKGAYLPAKGGIASEYEYLLASGAQYRLVSKQTDPATGLIHAVVELVGQD